MAENETVGVVKVSKSFSVNMDDVMSVLKSAAMVGAAAALTAIVQSIGKIEMGENMVIVIPMVTMALNAAVKWLKTSVYPTKETVENVKQ
jgi:hypothetical protein